MAQNCPTMMNILKADECLENLAGISADVYVGIKSDLAEPLTAEENVYSTPAFASGKGLYKIQGKNEAQKIAFSSLGPRKGYELTITVVIESLNKVFSKAGRAMNNLDLFFIVKDGEESLIMYDPNRRCEAESGGISGDTGDTVHLYPLSRRTRRRYSDHGCTRNPQPRLRSCADALL